MNLRRDNFVLISLLALCLGILSGTPAMAADYKIGAGDVLSISFWQDEKLNSVVRVGQDGRITLDIIGQVDAAGKTTEDLQNDIVRLMSRLNKNISQAVVRVTEYNYNYVFITGQVRTPGKRTFEEIPDLWTLINEAGGATELGDLSNVTIVRGGDQAGKVERVNVQAAIASGKLDQLPKVGREDTIEIPKVPGGVSGPGLGANVERKNIIYVLGAVLKPGPIQFEENTDIAEVLAMAGGSRDDADLKHVRVITKDGNYGQSYEYNLQKYTESGSPARYVLRKEDTFIVPAKKAAFLGLRLDIQTLATLAGTATAVALLVNSLNQNRGNTNVTVQR
jgi:polysaccharide export outer membrane protein